jgi:integrase/recombinase XerD
VTALEQMVADYLRVRRCLGFKLDSAEYILNRFVDYIHAGNKEPQAVTIEQALAFATAPPGASRRWQALRLSTVRCFARWAHAADPTVEVPPARLLPARPTRVAPYIYTDKEIGALLDAAIGLRPAIRAATYHTLIALMAATGIRTGETVGLDIASLDRHVGTLTVTGKYGKTRKLPLHPTVADALARYLDLRNELLPAATCSALLISTRGNRLHPSAVQQTFRQLRADAGLTTASTACRPRLHDLRHSFAVSTMLDAYTCGADPAAVLPLLATWLGHSEPSDTYWYLTGTAELLAAAADRLAAGHDGQQERHS